MNGIQVYYLGLSEDDCSFRVCRSFTAIFHKCMMNIAINVHCIFPLMLALCLILSITHYAHNNTGTIGRSLVAMALPQK